MKQSEIEKIWFGRGVLPKLRRMKLWFTNKCGAPCNDDYTCLRTMEFNAFRRQVREFLGIDGEMKLEYLPCFGFFATKRQSITISEIDDGDFELIIIYLVTQDFAKVRNMMFTLPSWWER